MKNYLHLDFSLQGKELELQDLITGQVYLAKTNLLKNQGVDKFQIEINRQRLGVKFCAKQIKHWLARGWDAALPLYLSSRYIKFVDSGMDRDHVLEELFSSYSEDAECPSLKHKRDVLAQSLLLPDVATPCEWLEKYGNAMANRRTKRSFREPKLSRQKALSIFMNATLRISETFRSREKLLNCEKYVKSYGCAFNIYAIIYDIDDLPAGVYEINAEMSTIGRYREGCFRAEMSSINWGMPAALTANYTIVLTINPDVYGWRYRHDRALRNLMIESGRVMHEFVISAACFDVQGVVTPATVDNRLSTLLQIDHHQEIPFYTGTFGAVYRDEGN